jgi:hypothetical protein
MRLTIDNFDSLGPRDYTASIAADSLPRVTRHLNRPAEAAFALLAVDPSFVVPVAGARVILSRADGSSVFTGYIAHAPAYEYLGWGQSGPAYRYAIQCVGDEFLLDRKTLKPRPTYVNRYAGDILKAIANALAPNAFSTAAVEQVEALTYSASPALAFSGHAAELALRTRSFYRAHDAALTFQPLGRAIFSINESDANFSPDALKLSAPDRFANDITVMGNVEPHAHVKDYFLGDGVSLGFSLSHPPFDSSTYTQLDEEYLTVPDPSLWTLTGATAAPGNALVVNGAATLSVIDSIELGGALQLQHGDFTFNAASTGLAGALCNGAFDQAHCLAGFLFSPSGAQTRIQPVMNGAVVGSSITTAAGKHYVLATRIFAGESYRRQRAFHSSAHPAGAARGNTDVATNVRAILELHVIDPANPGTTTTPSAVLYDGYIASCPAFAGYAVISASATYANIWFTRHLRAQDVYVSSATPGQPARTRIVAPQYEGGECHVSTTTLRFYAEQVPAPSEAIRAVYRDAGRASARATDAASIAQRSTRTLVTTLASPAARNATECSASAHALLDDRTQQAWSGEYSCWSNLMLGGASEIWPGDAVAVNVSSRGANFSAIARQVTIDVADLSSDLSRYTVQFANDAAESLSSRSESDAIGTGSIIVADAQFVADLTDAEITSTDSVTLYIDCGVAPPAGGGIEVRRSDTGWGSGTDRTFIGRFGTRTFSAPRLARNYTVYLRQYDASGHYSRYSTALHIDYPL